MPLDPETRGLLEDRGCGAARFRDALPDRGITPCIPSKKNRKLPVCYDQNFYSQRHKIGTVSGQLRDRRGIAMCYGWHAHPFFGNMPARAAIFYLDS